MKRSSHSSQKVSARISHILGNWVIGAQEERASLNQSFQLESLLPHFTDLPPPKSNAPYHLDLADVISQDEIKSINENGNISFHAVGDTGGINNATYQQINAEAMETDFSNQTNNNPLSFII